MISADTIMCTPTFSCFTLCDSCILRCRMCEKWKEDIYIKPERMPLGLEQWKDCARSLRRFAPDNFLINFGGGEITVLPWLFDLVAFCRGLNFKTNIATNGFLIDEAMVGRMAEAGLDYINISLDSIDGAVHDSLRGVNGVYARVMNAVDLIHDLAAETKISICSIIMEPTVAGIVDLARWAIDNPKIDMIYFMAVMQPNNTPHTAGWYERDFRFLWPENFSRVERALDQLIMLKQKGYKICNTVEHLRAFKAYFADPRRFVKSGPCHIDRAVHITSVGDVHMCYRCERLGSVREQPLADLWSNPAAVRLRREIKSCRENCHFLLNCHFEG